MASVLIESINQMLFDEVNEERIEEIIADANKMKINGQSAEAYNVLGMIAALRYDFAEVDRLFNAAINCSGRDVWTLENYSKALCNMNRLVEAMRIIDEVVVKDPDNADAINEAIKQHRLAFDTDGVRRLLKHSQQVGLPVDIVGLTDNIDRLDELMESHGVTWQEMVSRTELASKVLQDIGSPPVLVTETFGDGFLIVQVALNLFFRLKMR